MTIDAMQRNPAINTSNLYIDLNGKGQGTLSDGKGVDPKLIKARVERLLKYEEEFTRMVNRASESNLFSAGEINNSLVRLQILRTQLAPYIQECFFQATCIPQITLYRADVIAGMIKVVEQIVYTNVYIMQFGTNVDANSEQDASKADDDLTTINFAIRALQRENTFFYHKQTGELEGQVVSKINFPQGTLAPAGGSNTNAPATLRTGGRPGPSALKGRSTRGQGAIRV